MTANSPAAEPAQINTTPLHTLAQLRAGKLAGSTRLDLRGCGLHELSADLLAPLLRLADTLEVLDLSGNALQALPEAIASLHRLRILFCSDNRFSELPAMLGSCRNLDTLGFKANQISHVPPSALAPTLRWLILTDNRLSKLPDTLAGCTGLQKLMLAGNRLTQLPAGLWALQRLELLRLAANRFETIADALPTELLALPHLAWLAHAGNPFSQKQELAAEAGNANKPIPWSSLQIEGLLGEGASGHIHAACWHRDDGATTPVAVKLFKGAVTSDGLPRSERAACVAAGQHPHIVGVLGPLTGHPGGAQGLVLPRIAPQFHPLAAPPSMASCSRDVYAHGLRLLGTQAAAIAEGISSALQHLHRQGLVHGDLYGHNILVDAQGGCLLSDFGAASFLPEHDPVRSAALRALDLRAFQVLVDELAQHCDEPSALACWQRPGHRPSRDNAAAQAWGG